MQDQMQLLCVPLAVVRAVCATLVSHAPDLLYPIRLGDWDREWWLSAQEDLGLGHPISSILDPSLIHDQRILEAREADVGLCKT